MRPPLPPGTWEFACPEGTPLTPDPTHTLHLPFDAEKARMRELTRWAEDVPGVEPIFVHHMTPTPALAHVTSSPVVATPIKDAAIPSEERASLDGARADQPAGAPTPNLMSTLKRAEEAAMPETPVATPSSLEKARAVRSEKAAARRVKLDHLEAERAGMEANGVDFARLAEIVHTLRVLGESSKDPRIGKLERWIERQVIGADPEPPATIANAVPVDPVDDIADQLGERLSRAEAVRDQLDERLRDLQDQIHEVARKLRDADARFERLGRAKVAIDEVLAHENTPAVAA